MVKIIAELGINHESNEKIAEKLIENAYKSGCWAIKFQYRNLNSFYSSTNEIGDELINDQLQNTQLSLSKIKLLTEFAHKKGLKVGISFFTLKDFDEIIKKNIKFDFYKIPSAEFSNTELVRKVLKHKIMVIMSTGGHTLSEIKSQLKKYSFQSTDVLMHCTSNYPTEIGSQNLSAISELKKIKNITVGYSSHDIDYEVTFLAAGLGAEYIERHITLNKLGKSLDDSSSSELEEFYSINKILNNFETIMGDSKKPVNQGEIMNMQNLGTGAYSISNIGTGKFISSKDIEIKAPRIGLTLNEFKQYSQRPLIKNVSKDEPLTRSHFFNSIMLNKNDFEFIEKSKISIPIRFHDMYSIFKIFKTSNFEFHLSYQDLDYISDSLFQDIQIFENKSFSYHLPDYLNNYQLFDPISKNKMIKKHSLKNLHKIINLSDKLSNDRQIFVSSLSQNTFKDKKEYYYKLKLFIDNLHSKYNILFLPQWLPKKAWYFGGSYDIKLFSSFEDIEFLHEFDINICLDTAHLIMAANFAKEDWRVWFKELKPLIGHLHLSDSYGNDGEGVEFGKGDLGDPSSILRMEKVKVLEVWQGHLDNFAGFKSAIRHLRKKY